MSDLHSDRPQNNEQFPSQQGNLPPWQQPQSHQFPPPPPGYPNSTPPYNTPQFAGYYPPPNMPPQMPSQPPKKKLKAWQWILIGSSGLLLFCCVLGVIGAALGTNTTQQSGHAAAITTATPRLTSTPLPTATLVPTSTPIPPGQGDHMALGSDYQQDSAKGFIIVHPKGTFSSGDQLAYVISLDHSIGVTQAQLILVRVDSGGAEYSVFSNTLAISDPTFAAFANRIPSIGDVMNLFAQKAGKYRLELSDGHTVLAKADFTYTG